MRDASRAGFVPYARPSRYLDLIGPVYQAADDPAAVGLLVDERLTNSRGFLHAGVLVAVADTVMGHTAERAAGDGVRLMTVSMTSEFPGSAQLGDWIDGSAAARRVGRRLAFTNCEFRVGDRLVLLASAVFAVSRSPSPPP
jgi:acyl-coenzyme A thioesterase 13